MNDTSELTNKDILKRIGSHIESSRLSQGLYQEELASKAGVGLSTVARCEKGQGCGLDKLISILRALGALEYLGTLIQTRELSPVEIARHADKKIAPTPLKIKHRKRASKPKAQQPDTPWKWGDEK